MSRTARAILEEFHIRAVVANGVESVVRGNRCASRDDAQPAVTVDHRRYRQLGTPTAGGADGRTVFYANEW